MTGLTVLPSATPTASASPGGPVDAPLPASQLFMEDFENSSADTVDLPDYTGSAATSGMTYHADPYYENTLYCNGFITKGNSSFPGSSYCEDESGQWNVPTSMSEALGQIPDYGGTALGDDNHAVSASTINSNNAPAPPLNGIAFATDKQIPTPPNQFIVFSIDAAADNCPGTSNPHPDTPRYSFNLIQSDGSSVPTGGAIDFCSDTPNEYAGDKTFQGTEEVKYGRFDTHHGVLLSGNSVGLQLVNENNGTDGNDAAFDNIRILDGTPSLDQSFIQGGSPIEPANVAAQSLNLRTLELRVVNTSDLASKDGWSFSDQLPGGLTVFGTPTSSGCDGGADPLSITVSNGNTINVDHGNLSQGQKSCTISVQVRDTTDAPIAGTSPLTLNNRPANFTVNGVKKPAAAHIEIWGCGNTTTADNVTHTCTWTVSKSNSITTDNGTIGKADPNDVIHYKVTVTNTGTEDLFNPVITDPMMPAGSHTFAVLVAGETKTFGYDYTVTGSGTGLEAPATCPNDNSTGKIVNTVTGTGAVAATGEKDIPADAPASACVTPADAPKMTLDKKAATADTNNDGLTGDAGDVVTYTFTSTNTGTVPIDNITINDPTIGYTSPAFALAPSGQANDSKQFTAMYTITDADAAAGTINNTATATGKDPNGKDVTADGSATTPTVEAKPAIALTKTAVLTTDKDSDGKADPGDVIQWRFKVENTGNVPVTGVSVSDTVPPPSTSVTNPYTGADLAVGGVDDITGPVTTVDQAMYDALFAGGQNLIANTAVASATGPSPDNKVVTSTSNASVPVKPAVATMAFSKTVQLTVDNNGNGKLDAGDQASYFFEVTNTGNVSLTNVHVDDHSFGFPPVSYAGTLAPKASTGKLAGPVWTIDQAQFDLRAGTTFTNNADAYGTPPDGVNIKASASANVTFADPNPHLVTTKTASWSGSPTPVKAGQDVTYTITVTNDGNVTMHNAFPEDSMAGLPNFSGITPTTPATVAPKGSAVFTATYHVTQSDIDDQGAADGSSNGELNNTAKATGDDPGNNPFDDDTPSHSDVPVDPPNPHLVLTKHVAFAPGGDLGTPGVADKDDVLVYSLEVHNDGNMTLWNINPSDTGPSNTSTAFTTGWSGAFAEKPGDTKTFTGATYVVTQDDINHLAGKTIDNTATVSGAVGNPNGTAYTSDPSTVHTDVVPPNPHVKLTKSWQFAANGDANLNGKADKGDKIQYTLDVQNDGNMTLLNVTPADAGPSNGAGGFTTGWSGAFDIDPSQTKKFTGATYDVTQADIDTLAGRTLDNTATVSGVVGVPGGPTYTSGPSTVNTPVVDPDPEIEIQKTAVLVDKSGPIFPGGPAYQAGKADVGEQIVYSFVVTNTGNVTLHDVQLGDPMVFGNTQQALADLAPGASEPGPSVTYTVTQDDVDNGGPKLNTACADGRSPAAVNPGNVQVTDCDSQTVLVADPTPGLQLVKHATLNDTDGDAKAKVGETVTYAFTLTNIGNVRLHGLAVTDSRLQAGAVDHVHQLDPALRLDPGASIDVSADDYTVVQQDLDDGDVYNLATSTALTPHDADVASNPSDALVPVVDPILTMPLVKSWKNTHDKGVRGKQDWNDTITYTFKVTNTGNRTEHDVTVTDPLPGLSPVRPTAALDPLPVGDTATWTATYRVTDADVAAGHIDNMATVHFTPPTPRLGPPAVEMSSHSNRVRVPVRPLQHPLPLSRTSVKVVRAPVLPSGAIKPVSFSNHVHLTRFVAGNTAKGSVALYGPFDTRGAGLTGRLLRALTGCGGTPLASMAFRPHNGYFHTRKATVDRVGYYVWMARTTADHYNLDGSHRCGMRIATTKVVRAPYAVPGIHTGLDAQGRFERPVRPGHLDIPALHISAVVRTVGVRRGWMELPPVRQVGWLRNSAATGEPFGNVVIAGHVSDQHDHPGAFYRLQRAKVGQVVTVRTQVGTTEKFAITTVAYYSRERRLPASLFETAGGHALVLVTCAKKVTYPNGHFHYTRQEVVIAQPIG